MATALYPGSFDPLHLGHLSVIETAAAMFDRVVVAVIGNPSKRAGMFSIAERVGLIESATGSLSNVTAIAHEGLTVEAVRQTGSDTIIRTGHKDTDDEWSMVAMNERIAGTRTCFVPPTPAVGFISSSLVRSLVRYGRLPDAMRFVPEVVAACLATDAAPLSHAKRAGPKPRPR